ncbi:hypothetical protein T12_7092 [Trichinella patagoniensis]|uniref:Uncharacterized protein n=1 Tax=Trichinella patagoniensis TaxID=990121 RepID=A0A0V1A575_9BILA|nr:hypothetical protein T12_7092 [Trichinella patagoniensis]
MPYPIPLMKKAVVHQFYSLQYLTMTCFVNKLLSGDVQISEKNILAQDTGSLNQEQIRYILRQAND